MTPAELRDLIGVDEVHEGVSSAPCPVHPGTARLNFRDRGDGTIRWECEAGCREGLIAAALSARLGRTITATDLMRVNGARPPSSPAPPTTTDSGRYPDGRLVPIAVLNDRRHAAAERALGEELAELDEGEILRLTAAEHLAELSQVPRADRHLKAHADQYLLWIARVAAATRAERPGLIDEAVHRKVFPGRNAAEMHKHVAEMFKPGAHGPDAERLTEYELAELREKAGPVLDADDPLDDVGHELARLWGGDVRPVQVLYLAFTTRLLPKRVETLPCHTQLNGPPGTGKSYAVKVVRRLFPENAVVAYSAGSQRVLVYDPVSFRHKAIIFAEADSLPGVARGEEDNPAASLLRSLLQDGEAQYKLPIKDRESGQWTIQEIVKDGPTVLITTTVHRLRGEQLDSRLSALDVPDDPTQQRAALMAQADAELHGTTREPRPALIAMQTYLQAIAPIDVVVPYVHALDDLLARPRVDPRLLRDAARLLSLIKAVAIPRSARRERDDQGRIVARLTDYAAVADLIGEMYENTAGVSAKIRELVEALPEHGVLSVTQLAARLRVSKPAVSKRLRAALAAGWVINSESRHGYPAALRRGEPLPHRCGLPSVQQIEQWTPRTPVRP